MTLMTYLHPNLTMYGFTGIEFLFEGGQCHQFRKTSSEMMLEDEYMILKTWQCHTHFGFVKKISRGVFETNNTYLKNTRM